LFEFDFVFVLVFVFVFVDRVSEKLVDRVSERDGAGQYIAYPFIRGVDGLAAPCFRRADSALDA
jgi:hypothetical protein